MHPDALIPRGRILEHDCADALRVEPAPRPTRPVLKKRSSRAVSGLLPETQRHPQRGASSAHHIAREAGVSLTDVHTLTLISWTSEPGEALAPLNARVNEWGISLALETLIAHQRLKPVVLTMTSIPDDLHGAKRQNHKRAITDALLERIALVALDETAVGTVPLGDRRTLASTLAGIPAADWLSEPGAKAKAPLPPLSAADDAIYKGLYAARWPGMVARLRRWGVVDAEDVAQEVFTKFLTYARRDLRRLTPAYLSSVESSTLNDWRMRLAKKVEGETLAKAHGDLVVEPDPGTISRMADAMLAAAAACQTPERAKVHRWVAARLGTSRLTEALDGREWVLELYRQAIDRDEWLAADGTVVPPPGPDGFLDEFRAALYGLRRT